MQTYEYDKDLIKNSLTIEQIIDVLSEFDADPILQGDKIISKTVCHCGQQHKLFYYDNTKLFRCYTDCGDTFDIFELTRKVKSRVQKKIKYTPEGKEYTTDWELPDAIRYIAEKFGFSPKQKIDDKNLVSLLEDWKILNSYDRIKDIQQESQTVELKVYDDSILTRLPHPNIGIWEREGMKKEILDAAGICYDPKNNGIVIPHYDKDNNLIGIRERTLDLSLVDRGKYRPAIINGIMYNHPLSFNLYNLNKSKDNIAKIKKAFLFESEKSTLLYASYFGKENDISVACCGSAFIGYQYKLLVEAGAEEICISLDKQFQKVNDDEYKKLTKNLLNMQKKYGSKTQLSFLFDNNNLIGYKDSPIDRGPDIFLQLFKERIIL